MVPHSPDDSGPLDLQRLARERIVELKKEPTVRVDLLGRGPEAVVRKTYLNMGLRLLQTIGRQSRAAREFANLTAAAAAGLPCTPALHWQEQRLLGFVRSSTLLTRFVADTRPLKAVLTELPSSSCTVRRRLAREIGRLLAQLHANGILWCTPMPRNFLLQGHPETGQLLLCDLPSAVHFPGTVPPAAALLDLFDAAASPSRRRDFSRTERLRSLREYTGDDRDATRKLWRRLHRLSRRGHRWRKSALMALRTYILPHRPTMARRASTRPCPTGDCAR